MVAFSQGYRTTVHAPFPETARQINYFYFVSAALGISLSPGFMGTFEEGFNNEDFQILRMFVDINLTTDGHR